MLSPEGDGLRRPRDRTPQGAVTEPLLVGVRTASAALGLGRDATYQLVKTGRLRAVHVNRKIMIPRTELVAFIERETHPPPDDRGGGGP